MASCGGWQHKSVSGFSPLPLQFPTSVQIEDQIWVFDGTSGFLHFSPPSHYWSLAFRQKSINSTSLWNIGGVNRGVNPLLPKSQAEAVVLGSNIFLFGGRSGKHYSGEVVVFTPEGRKIDFLPISRTPTPRAGHSMVAISDTEVLIFGGRFLSRALGDIVLLTTNRCVWKSFCPVNQGPSPRFGSAMVLYQKTVYLFGGDNGSQKFSQVWALSLKKNRWRLLSDGAVAPRSFSGSLVIGDKWFLFGGEGAETEVIAFDFETRTFSSYLSLPEEEPNPVAHLVDKTVWVLGNGVYCICLKTLLASKSDSVPSAKVRSFGSLSSLRSGSLTSLRSDSFTFDLDSFAFRSLEIQGNDSDEDTPSSSGRSTPRRPLGGSMSAPGSGRSTPRLKNEPGVNESRERSRFRVPPQNPPLPEREVQGKSLYEQLQEQILENQRLRQRVAILEQTSSSEDKKRIVELEQEIEEWANAAEELQRLGEEAMAEVSERYSLLLENYNLLRKQFEEEVASRKRLERICIERIAALEQRFS